MIVASEWVGRHRLHGMWCLKAGADLVLMTFMYELITGDW